MLFNFNAWDNLKEIRDSVYDGTYTIDKYYIFYVYEPKKRMIMSIKFKHRVVQWAIYRVINPMLIKGYIKDSYGCIPERGPLTAMFRLKYWLEQVNRKDEQWYYLKLDISKYFYRISHRILKKILAKKIKDQRLLKLLESIIDCKHTPFGLPPGRSPGEVPLEERLFDVGMPIGNLLSQVFANVYLDALDQFCKRELQIHCYVRYMDDVIILSSSKAQLQEWKVRIASFLETELELQLNNKTCIRPINQRAYKKFRQAGMTAAGACGLIGNLEAESDGFYTNRVEYLCLKRLKENGKVYTDTTYTAAIDSGKISCEEFLHPLSGKQYGYGLAQWTSPGRKSGLWNFAKQRGVSIADEDMQLDFLLKELRESYSPVLAILKSATTIRQASDVVLKKFEIPANTGESVCESRAARGQKFYNDYAKEEKIVSVKISNCGHDENGHYAGGQAGDQTGTEYQIINWYNRPWLCVLRFEDQEVAALIAEMATQAANNNMIGYDQGTAGNSNDRYTFWEQLAANGYDPSKIKKPCETDCSQSTASIVKAVGYRLNKPKLKAVSIYLTTYNMRSAFKTAGAKVLTDQKYLTSGTCLKPGDILLNDNHHVAIAVSGDASFNATPAKKNYLEKGDSGSEVTTMQKMLIKVGYSCGSAGADGDFGSGTDEALRKFQKDNGLVVDGQYGTNSKAKLTALYNKKVGTTTSTKKDVTTVAKEVIAGKWGSGDERKKKLTAAGYNYDTVQKKVNELLKASTKKSVAEVAKEVVSGKWGNGADRKKKLEAAGYNYAEVQKEVNKLLK